MESKFSTPLFFAFLLSSVPELGVHSLVHHFEPPPPLLGTDLPDLWYTDQRLDHFNNTGPGSNVTTWRQRYYVYWDEFRRDEGGPIFLFLNGEWTARPGVSRFIEPYMREFGAAVVSLEHRFYGRSQPFERSSVENLRLLSTEQALKDTAQFIEYFNREYNLTEMNKWILFGCSYSANMVAYFQLHYPHLTVGAIAHSGPVEAEYEFSRYLEVVATDLGPKCTESVRKATQFLSDLIKSGQEGWRQVERIFHFCPGKAFDGANRSQVTYLASKVSGFFSGLAQQDVGSIPHTCNRILAVSSNSPQAILWQIVAMILEDEMVGCLDVDYRSKIAKLQNEDTDLGRNPYLTSRAWIYQTCTEYGYYQTTSSPRQLFPTNLKPIESAVQLCVDTFGSHLNANSIQQGVNRTNQRYLGQKIVGSVKNVVFTNGLKDPWHVLSVLKPEISNPSVRVLIDEHLTHCQVSDRTKEEIRKAIREFLGK